jgi:membrane-bound ClpP family serine protease
MKRRWSTQALVKYTLLQLPIIVLLTIALFVIRQWVDLPLWLIVGIIALWAVKDIAMFPVVWRAYEQGRPGDATSIVGMQGTVTERLAPAGYIRIRGELWRAEVIHGGNPIERGKRVLVMGINGLTLLVRPEEKETTKT